MRLICQDLAVLTQRKTTRTNRSTTRHLETPGANSYSFVYWLIIPCLYIQLLRSIIQTNPMARKHHYLI